MDGPTVISRSRRAVIRPTQNSCVQVSEVKQITVGRSKHMIYSGFVYRYTELGRLRYMGLGPVGPTTLIKVPTPAQHKLGTQL